MNDTQNSLEGQEHITPPATMLVLFLAPSLFPCAIVMN